MRTLVTLAVGLAFACFCVRCFVGFVLAPVLFVLRSQRTRLASWGIKKAAFVQAGKSSFKATLKAYGHSDRIVDDMADDVFSDVE